MSYKFVTWNIGRIVNITFLALLQLFKHSYCQIYFRNNSKAYKRCSREMVTKMLRQTSL